MTTIRVRGVQRARLNDSWWPYGSKASVSVGLSDSSSVDLAAVPYFTWGNRETGAMRVWIPAE